MPADGDRLALRRPEGLTDLVLTTCVNLENGEFREGGEEAVRSSALRLGGEGKRVMPWFGLGLGFRNKGRNQHLLHGLGSDHSYTRFEYKQIHLRNGRHTH